MNTNEAVNRFPASVQEMIREMMENRAEVNELRLADGREIRQSPERYLSRLEKEFMWEPSKLTEASFVKRADRWLAASRRVLAHARQGRF